MKKLSLLLLAASLVSTASAQLSGNGYYRIQNAVTERYIVVMDNKASISASTGGASVDLLALRTLKGFDKVVSNPASVVYIESSGSGYNLISQGMDLHEETGYYIQIRDNDNGTYRAYGSYAGFELFLSDMPNNTKDEIGYVMTSGSRTREWFITPIKTNTEGQYIGITPDIKIGNKYYTTFYAGFPFSFASSGMKAYYISDFNSDMACLKEITDNVISRSTPIIIECSSADPYKNQLSLQTSGGPNIRTNKLKGQLFSYDCTDNRSHDNRVAYDAATMRVLREVNGELMLAQVSDLDYLPANSAYLPVDGVGSVKVVSESEYIAGIHDVKATSEVKPGVYSLTGAKVREDNSVEGLPSGIYIVGGKKIVVK